MARLWQIRRECRGLIFNKSGQLISRRYHKFFNVGQNEECAPEKINWKQKYHLLEKFDGCMMSPILLEGDKIVWGTKLGPTDVSERMEQEYLTGNKIDYNAFCLGWLKRGFTPIFEWCSMKHHIVLNYENDLLVLTNIRNIKTGAYVTYQDMVDSAKPFGVPVTPHRSLQQSQSIDDFLNHIKQQPNIEGYVIKFEQTHEFYKIKSDWYFERSRQDKRLPSQEKEIWLLILDNKMDDLMPFLNTEMRNRIDKFTQDLYQALETTAKQMQQQVAATKQAGVTAKVDFVNKVRKEADPMLHTLLFAIFDGKNARDEVIKTLLRHMDIKNFEKARTLLAQGIAFDY